MKTNKILLTLFAFTFAIAAAFASKTIVSDPYEDGVIEGFCNSPIELDQTCYFPGSGEPCTIDSDQAYVSETDCDSELKRSE